MLQNIPSKEYPTKSIVLKLIDFNLSRRIPDHLDFIHADPYGNPSYMAPETMYDNPIAGAESDIWSAGVIMFLVMGGYPPFWNNNYNHLLENIKEANYAVPHHLWNHVDKTSMNTLKSLLEKEHTKRPTAEELLLSKWFQCKISKSTWCSQSRIDAFLHHLNQQRNNKNHRSYKLKLVKREAFVPDAEMITRDVNNNIVEDVDKRTDVNNNIVVCHWLNIFESYE